MEDTPKSTLVDIAKRIGAEVAGLAATDVDQKARFPAEALNALKEARLLSAYVPKELGGAGASITELADICEALGQHCASTAMVFAMHQIQVVSIVRHALTIPWYRDYLKELVECQNLIASVTSEVGVGGEMRSSMCGILIKGDSFTLDKDATTISYGAQADDLLVTARRSPDASSSDQSLVLVRKADYRLEQKAGWDTMGMRGTCSPPFKMTSRGSIDQIMTVPFADIASQTMVPISHILWGSCWLGTSAAAVNKARAFVRGQARAKPGSVPPTALRLAEVTTDLHLLRTSLQCIRSEYELLAASPTAAADELSTIGYALRMNNTKVAASEMIVRIVNKALLICGIMGYKNDSKFAMGRHLRDAHSAALMVANDRILATNAAMLLIYKDD